MVRIIDIRSTSSHETSKNMPIKSIKSKTANSVKELKKKLTKLNSEKINLLLKNEELKHELHILRRKYRQLVEHY